MQLVDSDLLEGSEAAVSEELAVASRAGKRQLRCLEDTVAHLSVLVDSVTGISPPDFDTNTLAVLRGRLVRCVHLQEYFKKIDLFHLRSIIKIHIVASCEVRKR